MTRPRFGAEGAAEVSYETVRFAKRHITRPKLANRKCGRGVVQDSTFREAPRNAAQVSQHEV